MRKFQSLLLNFGEAVLAKESGSQEGKLVSSWDLGIWLGRWTRTNEHLVGTRTGVIRARTVERRPETLKWDRELYEALNFVPWLIEGPVATPEAGRTPTPGCRACDEESSGVVRRGRPYNHTPGCAERQAVFREQLRMLSAAEAPLAMEPVAGPVLPWPGTSETAGAPISEFQCEDSAAYGC